METLNCFEKFICKALKKGQVPKHIGFIMDGNRRHAQKLNLDSPIKGHVQGVKSLKKCLLICRQMNVQMVTMYCFSIENFKRSQTQVEGLMKLFLETFDQCSHLTQYLQRENIRVNIVGDVALFREEIQECIKKIEEKTKMYNKMQVNLCFGYDSIWQSNQSIHKMKQSSYKDFIDNLKISRYMDILVRTANQKRLSNFMLAQSAYSYICILKEHWPEMNIISYFKIFLEYNYNRKEISRQKQIVHKLLEQRGKTELSEQKYQENSDESKQFMTKSEKIKTI